MNGPSMNGFRKTLAGSVLFHAALLAAAALVYSGANRVFITPVYTVDLVAPGKMPGNPLPVPEPAQTEPAKPEPPAPAAEPQKIEAVEAPKDTVKIKEKPSLEDALKTIKKKVEKRKDEALVASSIDDLKKKIEATRASKERVAKLREELAARANTEAKAAPAPPVNPAAGGGAARANLEERYSAYYGVLRDKVQENWIYPQGLKDNRISVIVSIKIERGGKLLEVSVEKSSGNRAFDDSLLKAIKKAAPFPPLPVDLEGSFLETGLRFCPGCV